MPAAALTYSARPTIHLDGQAQERIAELLTGLVMCEQTGGLSTLELRLRNAAPLTSGRAEYAYDCGGDLALGKEIMVGAGDAAAPIEIFRGFVTGLEGVFSDTAGPELTVLAEDALQKARLVRRTKAYENSTLADIARNIANQHGFTANVSGLSEGSDTHVQLHETDLGFLRRLAQRADADLQIVGTELQLAPRSEVRRGEIELALGNGLRQARVLADLAHQVTETTARGWDARQGHVVEAAGLANALGPGAGDNGADVLQQVLGARSLALPQPMFSHEQEARELAATVRNRRARDFLRVRGLANGNPALRVGTHVRLTGLGEWFSNTFYVVKARHLYDLRDGYRTEFEGECAFLGRGSA